MDFSLSDDQKMLVDTAASFARKESPVDRARRLRDEPLGYEPAMWRKMGELGWLGIPFAEDLGGYGGKFVDLALVLEQLGRTLVPEPVLPSIVLGGMTVARAGSREQAERYLAPVIAGEATLALAYAERHARYDVGDVRCVAEPDGAGHRLRGEKVWVLGGHAADHLIVSARAGGELALFVVPRDAEGLEIQPVQTMDGRRAAMVRLDGVAVDDAQRLAGGGGAHAVLEAVMDLGAAAAVAEGTGIAAEVLALTVDYLKTREQFGVPIGTFQALQHRAVDMFVAVELCKSVNVLSSLEADASGEHGAARRAEAVSAAKVQLATGGRYVVREAIQLFGGIGCTDEHDVGLYFKRLQVLCGLFGDDAHHVRRYGNLPGFTSVLDAEVG